MVPGVKDVKSIGAGQRLAVSWTTIMSHRVFRSGGAILILVAAIGSGQELRGMPATAASAVAAPLAFEENQGQFDARARFVSRGRDYTLFLTDREAVLALRTRGQHEASASDPTSVVRLSLEQANAQQAIGLERLPGVVNYLIGNDPSSWQSADFPTTRSGIQPSQRGRIDQFIVRIEP